jgi:hypothetical protein
VRDAKGAEVGKHGTVIGVSDNLVTVECRLGERVTRVLAQMWDVLPERLWNHLLKRRTASLRVNRISASLGAGSPVMLLAA